MHLKHEPQAQFCHARKQNRTKHRDSIAARTLQHELLLLHHLLVAEVARAVRLGRGRAIRAALLAVVAVEAGALGLAAGRRVLLHAIEGVLELREQTAPPIDLALADAVVGRPGNDNELRARSY